MIIIPFNTFQVIFKSVWCLLVGEGMITMLDPAMYPYNYISLDTGTCFKNTQEICDRKKVTFLRKILTSFVMKSVQPINQINILVIMFANIPKCMNSFQLSLA